MAPKTKPTPRVDVLSALSSLLRAAGDRAQSALVTDQHDIISIRS